MTIFLKFLSEFVSSGFLDVSFPDLDITFLSEDVDLDNRRTFQLIRLINNLEAQYKSILPCLLPVLIVSTSYDEFRRQISDIEDGSELCARQFLIDLDALLLQIYFSSPIVVARFLPSSGLLSEYISDSSELDDEMYNRLLSNS